MTQTLSKSRFIQGLTCSRKLVYGRQNKVYRNRNHEDSFLASLAEGGFQVGELAKVHFPDGYEVTTLDQTEALAETNALLENESVVIFEAAIQFKNCFIRVDVLEKVDNRIRIHEVKAKSFNSEEQDDFLTKAGQPRSEWAKYLYDVAFQKWVVRRAFPDANVTANLMLVDKAAVSPVDGLNQCFRIMRENGRSSAVQVSDAPDSVLAAQILKSVPVDYQCDVIYELPKHGSRFVGTFSELVARLSEICQQKSLPAVQMLKDCSKCEFKRLDMDDPMTSGFHECLAQMFPNVDPDKEPSVFDLWDYRRKDEILEQGVIRLVDLTEDDLGGVEPHVPGDGVTRTARQWLQVEKARNNDSSPWLDKVAWQNEISSWTYPLHFIDFETTRVALPFFSGQRPYQSIAFQFSHHTVDANGAVDHADQFLKADPRINPNIDFVRALKRAIGGDEGTVFMYSPHENTTLNDVFCEMELSGPTGIDVDEFEGLLEFLKSLIEPSRKRTQQWTPSRPMVDLLALVKKYLYLADTNGSNSLKAVLPAILNASEKLKKTYSSPIYGKGLTINSLNLTSRQWIELDAVGRVINPYNQLPDPGADLSPQEREELEGIIQIRDGGAALTAYARLMFEDLSIEQRQTIEGSLLQYCELDTLAMVFLYQGICDLLGH